MFNFTTVVFDGTSPTFYFTNTSGWNTSSSNFNVSTKSFSAEERLNPQIYFENEIEAVTIFVIISGLM